MSSFDCPSLAGSESLAQNFIGSVPNPEILWIFASSLIFMTLLRRILFPCVTLRGLEDTIKSVDTMLQEHMGLGILPLNVTTGIGSTDLCFVYGQGRRLLDCNEHLPHIDRRLLDHGDPERSRRCVDFEDQLCRIKDTAHDLRLKSSSTFLKRHFRLSVPSPYAISFKYRQIISLRHDIEHSIVVSSKHHNRLKLDVAAFLRRQNSM